MEEPLLLLFGLTLTIDVAELSPKVTAAVKQYFPNTTFSASSAFVATWDDVPYSNGGGVVTFQVVLVSSVHRSFILINYGDMTATGWIWLAGYNTADSVNSFTIPVTSASELSSSSNINVNGRSSFHVDGSPNLPTSFLPSGDGEIVIPTADDGSSAVISLIILLFAIKAIANKFRSFWKWRNGLPADVGSSEAIVLQQPFKFFVNNNGLLTFTEQLSDHIPLLNCGRDFVAPLWTHLDNRRGGTISYREDTSSAVLTQVTAAVNKYFPNRSIPFKDVRVLFHFDNEDHMWYHSIGNAWLI